MLLIWRWHFQSTVVLSSIIYSNHKKVVTAEKQLRRFHFWSLRLWSHLRHRKMWSLCLALLNPKTRKASQARGAGRKAYALCGFLWICLCGTLVPASPGSGGCATCSVMRETWVPIPGIGKILLEKEKATTCTLAWKIPWRRSLVGCTPWGRWGVGHGHVTWLSLFTFIGMAEPGVLPSEGHRVGPGWEVT